MVWFHLILACSIDIIQTIVSEQDNRSNSKRAHCLFAPNIRKQAEQLKREMSPTALQQPRGRNRIPRLLVLVAVTAAVGFSRNYSLHHNELLSSYGADFLGPLFIWYSAMGIFRKPGFIAKIARSRLTPFIALGLCSGEKYLQYLTLNLNLPGNYDPNDYIAFASGTAFALGIDRLIYGKQQ